MKIAVVGDIHAEWEEAEKVLERLFQDERASDLDLLIQVGDMGFGFPNVVPWRYEPPCPAIWIDGNHENFDLLKRRDKHHFGYDIYHHLWPREWQEFLAKWEYAPRGTIRDGILYIGGASSIDKAYRTRGLDWWPEENISYSETESILSAIEAYTGEIHTVISHDCPSSFDMQPVLKWPEKKDANREFLEHVRKVVRPKRWFFGHYHAAHEGSFEGCYYRCIDMVGSKAGIDYVIFNTK